MAAPPRFGRAAQLRREANKLVESIESMSQVNSGSRGASLRSRSGSPGRRFLAGHRQRGIQLPRLVDQLHGLDLVPLGTENHPQHVGIHANARVEFDRFLVLRLREIQPARLMVDATQAELEPGVVGRLLSCEGPWCRLEVAGFRGWVKRGEIWGAGEKEDFD